ncbi:hypothetical protein J2T57_001444 [Natronocella acetinitrilica]|uniref:Phosphoribosylanthranilate isomerase n=1 Tax=Natronocella acetinitrilica TaxID=414046 RepID=A0AAE3G2Q6_9GAMM|nr:hypothetical protein [Natronocella acetinitrilica]MCP1674342.1 hypothetical protein [Natronocella acetinitrilica]
MRKTRLLRCCTLTGIDPATGPGALRDLAAEFPFVEFGVLYSVSQAGSGRYPAMDWIERLVSDLGGPGGPALALHVCGKAVFQFLDVERRSHVREVAAHFGRVQLNLRATVRTPGQIREALALAPAHQRIITQHNTCNAGLTTALLDADRHEVLFDASGGLGRLPDAWPDPITGKPCGYAGGLGPDTLPLELPRIAAAAGGQPYWIDMEGRIRDAHDRFDLVAARRALAVVSARLTPQP